MQICLKLSPVFLLLLLFFSEYELGNHYNHFQAEEIQELVVQLFVSLPWPNSSFSELTLKGSCSTYKPRAVERMSSSRIICLKS